jgi:hypothetical protein
MLGKTTTMRKPAEDRVQIQFRLGEALVAKIDAAAEAETEVLKELKATYRKKKTLTSDERRVLEGPDRVTRNDWLAKACQMKIDGEGHPGIFVASEVTARRVPILFRVKPLLKKSIDKDWKAKKISSRTMWIVEAILARLSAYTFE